MARTKNGRRETGSQSFWSHHHLVIDVSWTRCYHRQEVYDTVDEQLPQLAPCGELHGPVDNALLC
jgi:hypothetical protein